MLLSYSINYRLRNESDVKTNNICFIFVYQLRNLDIKSGEYNGNPEFNALQINDFIYVG